MRYLLIVLLCSQAFALIKTPTVSEFNPPVFSDDIDFNLMERAIDRQLKYFSRINLNADIQFGERVYKKQDMRDSLVEFKNLMAEYKSCLKILAELETIYTTAREICQEYFNRSVTNKFDVYRPEEKSTFFTAYYSPDLEASLTQDSVYKNPVYSLPSEDHLRTLTREEIDFDKKLTGHGYELFYVKQSLFDLYLFHIEGGGRVKIKQADGSFTTHFLSYAGTNRQKLRFIYHYMLDQGMITQDNMSLETQRRYLRNNPQDQRAVYAYNPSYVYFKITQSEPLGVGDIPLTEGRSIAIDTRLYKQVGMLHFVSAKKPTLDKSGNIVHKKFGRFFISQDTGGAIRGAARVDLYMGYGREAEVAAHNTRTYGNQFILLLKNE